MTRVAAVPQAGEWTTFTWGPSWPSLPSQPCTPGHPGTAFADAMAWPSGSPGLQPGSSVCFSRL